MLREGIKEEPRKTIDIFHSGLNLEIWDKVKFLPFDDLNDLIHFSVRIEQQLKIRYAFKEDYPNTFYSRREFKREGYPSKSRYERSRVEFRERKIKKEKIEKSLSGAEPDIDNILPFINKPCEEVLKEIFMFGVEQDINLNCSSTEKKNEGLIEKEEEEEETKKEEESLTTPPANIAKK